LSLNPSDSNSTDEQNQPRKDGEVNAQEMRSCANAAPDCMREKPCDHGDCGFDGPWHCGCSCVRQISQDISKADREIAGKESPDSKSKAA